jgi:hypothetical protein
MSRGACEITIAQPLSDHAEGVTRLDRSRARDLLAAAERARAAERVKVGPIDISAGKHEPRDQANADCPLTRHARRRKRERRSAVHDVPSLFPLPSAARPSSDA